MILADTSVWIDHLRRGSTPLRQMLEQEKVMTHPFVIGELACGNLRNRREILDLLAALPSTVLVSDEETLHFIERHRLMGRGLGWIDIHLLAAVVVTEDARLWTMDKRLSKAAAELNIA